MDGVQLGMQAGAPVEREQGKKGISGSTIKIIAVIAMLIDHTGAVILERQMIAKGMYGLADAQAAYEWMARYGVLYWGYMAMRLIGRLGFPIFCFLLVEGFQRTRDVRKYALRLGLFALISELPFNLAIAGGWSAPGYQNVYFTLLIGLLALCVFDFFAKFEQAEDGRDLPGALRMAFLVTGVVSMVASLLVILPNPGGNGVSALCFLVIVVIALVLCGRKWGLRRVQTICADMTALGIFMVLAELLHTDYAGMGVLAISAMYAFRKHKVIAMLAGCIVLAAMDLIEVTAFFTLIPIAFYNGKRGLKMKYFFYAFYPAHLLALYLIAVLMGLGGVAIL